MKKNYSELLKDPRWQKKRLEVMQRDGFKCSLCNSDKKTLNVHHKFYKKNADPWDYEDEDLVTICEDCHHEVELLKVKNIQFHDIYSISRLSREEDSTTNLITISCKDLFLIKVVWGDGTTVAGLSITEDVIPVVIDALIKCINHE